MNDLLAIALQNTIGAGVLAVLVYGLTRIVRRPPVAHVLWLLVLVKLIAPPIISLEWVGLGQRPAVSGAERGNPAVAVAPSVLRDHSQTGTGRDSINAPPAIGESNLETTTSPAAESESVSATTYFFETCRAYVELYWYEIQQGLLFVWIAGASLCGSVAVFRVLRFDRKLQGTLPAPQRLRSVVTELTEKLGLRRVPTLRMVEGCRVPFLWCFGGRPVVVLPTRLVPQLDDRQMSMVLAHELSHLRRHDHWIRRVELLISMIYWWNPLVWFVRKQLHQAADLCCDAWVDWIFPDNKRRYAEVLLKAASLAGTPHRAPSLSCPFLNCSTLQARIAALLEGSLARHLSRTTAVIVSLAALLLLPSFVRSTSAENPSLSSNEPAVKRPFLGQITGAVTVEETGEPVAGATISASLCTITKREYETATGRSDAAGRYSIDVPLGNVGIWPWLCHWPAGYWSSDRPTNVVTTAAASVATKDFALRRGAVWTVRVRDAVAHRPLPGVQCTVIASEGPPQRTMNPTDANGIVQATLPGFYGKFQLVVFDEKHRGRFEVTSALLEIAPGFRIEQLAEIIPSAKTEAQQLKDKHGKTAALQGAPRVSLVDGKALIDVELRPTASKGLHVVRGTICAQNGRPIAGARVETAQTNEDGGGFVTGASTTTGSDGSFEFADPEIRKGGQVSLIITRDGYAGAETSPRALPSEPGAPLDLGRITLPRGKSLRVRVVDAAGKPAVGAWVEPRGGYAAIVESRATDADGSCVLKNLPPGIIKVFATYGTAGGNASGFPADEPAAITIRLKPIPQRPQANQPRLLRPLEPGTPAPELTVVGWADGKSRSLADYRGKVVVLDFWGLWCEPCVRMLPLLKRLESAYKDRDVVFLAIHTAGTDMDQVRDFQQHMKLDFATALDVGDDANEGASVKKYSVRGFPTTYIIDRSGRIAWTNVDVPAKDRLQNMKRAAKALSISWPIDEKQPKEQLAAQMDRLREYLFQEAIDRVLLKPTL